MNNIGFGDKTMTVKPRLKPHVLPLALAMGALASVGVAMGPAQAEFSIAYCDGAAYATRIYRVGGPEAPLTMRLYSRADGVTFLNTEANRAPNPEGYIYSNVRGENQWELSIPNQGNSCTLSRNGTVVDSGNITTREPSSGD